VQFFAYFAVKSFTSKEFNRKGRKEERLKEAISDLEGESLQSAI
jgi:hypothetical protein